MRRISSKESRESRRKCACTHREARLPGIQFPFSKALLLGIVLLASLPVKGIATAQDTIDGYFRQNCFSCHTIGGGVLTGPDLKDVTQRKDKAWLAGFMKDPRGVIERGDPYAQKLLEDAGGKVIMPPSPNMTNDLAEKLLVWIESESANENSQFKGLQLPTKPFTQEDRDQGREIFLGRERLSAGGTACIACHSMHDTPALGGGRLGPDLTNIYEVQGRKALSAWLVAPQTQTMQPVFKDHPLTVEEIHALVAYFEASAGESPSEPSSSRVAFLLMGLIAAAALVFAFDAIWKRRFQGVRQPLVDSTPATSSRGHSARPNVMSILQ